MKEIKNRQEYLTVIQNHKPLLLDFYADWCGPCQTLLPIIERLAEKHKDSFTIVKVNVDKNPELAREFNVRSIPALFFVQDGIIKESLVGLQTQGALEKKINAYSTTIEA